MTDASILPIETVQSKLEVISDIYNSGEYERAINVAQAFLKKYLPAYELSYKIQEMLSYSYLAMGQYDKGWKLWKYRSSAIYLVNKMSAMCTLPFWLGDKVNGNLLILAEEGLGDELYHSAFFHLLKDRCGKVFIECDQRLKSIFETTYPEFTFFERHNSVEFLKYGHQSSCYGLMGDLQPYLARDGLKETRKLILPADERKEEKVTKTLDCVTADIWNDLAPVGHILQRMEDIHTIPNHIAHFAGRLEINAIVQLDKRPNILWVMERNNAIENRVYKTIKFA